MSPGQFYLSKTETRGNVASVAPTPAGLVGQFQDYLIMYQALTDPALAVREAASLTPANLDNANSMTYLYAWLYSHEHEAGAKQ